MDFGRVASWFVPSNCPLCGTAVDPDSLVCGGCMGELNRSRVLRDDPPDGVDRIASCADHQGVARDLLAAYKFRHLIRLAGLIAGFMADATGPADRGAVIVPVPPARLRTWVRGFDPVDLLAGEIRELTGIPAPAIPVLTRRGSGRQRGRNRAGRLADPPGIVALADAGRVIGGHGILLIDDVMTTGATLSAAAGALRQAGAAWIHALTFTRRL